MTQVPKTLPARNDVALDLDLERARRLNNMRRQFYLKRNSMDAPNRVAVKRPDPVPSRVQIKSNKSFCLYCGFLLLTAILLIGVLACLHYFLSIYNRTSLEEYEQTRASLLAYERSRRLGNNLKLTTQEEIVDGRLAAVKTVDEEMSVNNFPYDYSETPHFLKKFNISETDLYDLLRSMPKGGLLHVHESGMFKVDLLIELSYNPDLWVCVNMQGEFEEFIFSAFWPEKHACAECECNWQKMTEFWRNKESNLVEQQLRRSFSLTDNEFTSKEQVTKHIKRMHRLIHGLITYKPVWEDFLFRMLSDLHADGVQYVELRSSLPILYDLNGSNYTIYETAHTINMVSQLFKSSNLDFIAMKLIYAPMREGNESQIEQYLKNARYLKFHFSNLFVGFDMISFGDECERPSLKNYSVKLLHISKEIDFYFHAGESNCFNTTVSGENLIDALLLNSRRFGNSLQLPNHPELLRLLRLMNRAIEICPLSNHYLQFFNDFETHPLAYLLAAGYPVVIGSDYPYYWNAAPLTDDFYVAFVGISTAYGNLKLLKQLAKNSLLYSALRGHELVVALDLWSQNWSKWIWKLAKKY